MASIRKDANVPIKMRDGTTLEADIYRPDDSERHPAILLRSYGRAYGRSVPMLYDFVEAGYAFINSELRGRGSSEGEWKPEKNLEVEGPDGYDSIEWIAAQSWCDGNVGMFGISHMTCFQWLAAMEKPPHLKAIAPWSGDFNEKYVPSLTGGVTSLITTLLWLPREAADVVNRLEKQGHDVTEMRQILAWAAANPTEVYEYLPFKDVPLAKFGRLRELLSWRLQSLSQPELGELRQYEKVMVPCFHECGWYDGCAWFGFENFNGMQNHGGSEQAREGQYIVAGPWPHSVSFQSSLGSCNFGAGADTRGSRIIDLQIAFFNKYLKGETVELPKVRYFVMGANQWRTAESWPLPQTDWQRFYLHSQGGANTAAGDGELSRQVPGNEPADIFIYNPHNPVPTTGGPLIGAADGPGFVVGPIEQYHLEKRQDVLCYTTAELEEDIEVTGPLQIHVFASTSAKDTDFTAKLIDVYPDGRAYNIAEGIIRASGRNLGERPEPVNPGQVYEFVITMGHTSQLFRIGHRLRIDLSSSNFPQFDRNMNTGNPIGEDSRGIPAMQTIYHQPENPSYIDLPVIPRRVSNEKVGL